jgi:hypothetical protein
VTREATRVLQQTRARIAAHRAAQDEGRHARAEMRARRRQRWSVHGDGRAAEADSDGRESDSSASDGDDAIPAVGKLVTAPPAQRRTGATMPDIIGAGSPAAVLRIARGAGAATPPPQPQPQPASVLHAVRASTPAVAAGAAARLRAALGAHAGARAAPGASTTVAAGDAAEVALGRMRSRVGHSAPPIGVVSVPRELFAMPLSLEAEVARASTAGWSEAQRGRLAEAAASQARLHEKQRVRTK